MKNNILKKGLIGCAILVFLIVCVLHYAQKEKNLYVEPVESVECVMDTLNIAEAVADSLVVDSPTLNQ